MRKIVAYRRKFLERLEKVCIGAPTYDRRRNPLSVTFQSYGHWKIVTTYYGTEISCITTDSKAVDDYNDEDQKRQNRGYDSLRRECIKKWKGL